MNAKLAIAMMSKYVLGPSLEEAVRMANCPVCGKPKCQEMPLCKTCYCQRRPDRVPFHDVIDVTKDPPLEMTERAWEAWIGPVLARQN